MKRLSPREERRLVRAGKQWGKPMPYSYEVKKWSFQYSINYNEQRLTQ